MTHAALRYYDNVRAVLERIAGTQMEAIAKAAGLVAHAVAGDGMLYTFGSGHSLSVAVELYYRAGGLVPVDVVHEKTFGRAERIPGYAAVLLDSYPVASRDVLLVVSNSGRNPLPVEMALEGRRRGMKVIAITSLDHTRSVQPRAGAPVRLCEASDVAIDNCGVAGDATVALGNGDGIRVGPTSTIAGVFIANAVVSAAAEELMRRNIRPPVFVSANVDGGDERNQAYLRFIRERTRGL